MSEEPGPADRAPIAESVGLALLVVLESLSASERVAFVLHDVFGYGSARVADDGRIVEIDIIRNPEKLKGVVA